MRKHLTQALEISIKGKKNQHQSPGSRTQTVAPLVGGIAALSRVLAAFCRLLGYVGVSISQSSRSVHFITCQLYLNIYKQKEAVENVF